MIGTVVLVLVVAVIVALVMAATLRTKKHFGLTEAEAAQKYTGGNAESAKAVLGVVVGVLGYENRVSEDASAALAGLDKEAHEREEAEKTCEEQIRVLEAQINALRTAATGDRERGFEIRATAKLFS